MATKAQKKKRIEKKVEKAGVLTQFVGRGTRPVSQDYYRSEPYVPPVLKYDGIVVEPVGKTQDEKLREVLNSIDEMLSKGWDSSSAGHKLWDILSALRGPDNGEDSLKYATTGIIRRKAFPKTFTRITGLSSTRAVSAPDSFEKLAVRREQANAYDHFSRHYRRAFHSLGLSLGELNLDKQ